jgi:hypothetical protein
MIKIVLLIVSAVFILGCVEVSEEAFSNVKQKDGRIYIIDQTGHKWDVTQAESLGFKPEGFQYGLGKDAFTPLDDSRLTGSTDGVAGGLRVIGISEGAEAKAYSVSRLRYHEIANSTLGGTPVAVGY